MPIKFWKPSELEELRKLAPSMVKVELAEYFNVTVKQAERKCWEERIRYLTPNRSHVFNWEPEHVYLLRKLAATKTAEQVAVIIGCTKHQAYHKAHELGIGFAKSGELHHRAKHEDHDVELCRALAEEGLTLREISEKMEIPRDTVSQWIKMVTRNKS